MSANPLSALSQTDPEQGSAFDQSFKDYHDRLATYLIKMHNGHLKVEEGIGRIMRESMAFRQKMGQGNGIVYPEERASLVEENFEARLRGEIGGTIKTGLPCLDEVLLGGLMPGTITVVAGVPGSGKSALLQQMGEQAAEDGRKVLFVAVEMDNVQLSYRTLARKTNLDATSVRMGEVTDKERDIVRREIKRLKALPIAYKDSGDMSTMGIYQAILEFQKEMGEIDLIVADYLQILQDDRGGGNENLRLESISRAFMGIAKEFHIPVLVGSQINRESVKEGKRPHLHHLRGSGAIGQDASVVLLLHPDYNPDAGVEKQDEEKVTIIVEKNRNGRAGIDIVCTFHQPQQRFREWDPKHQSSVGQAVLRKRAKGQPTGLEGF